MEKLLRMGRTGTGETLVMFGDRQIGNAVSDEHAEAVLAWFESALPGYLAKYNQVHQESVDAHHREIQLQMQVDELLNNQHLLLSQLGNQDTCRACGVSFYWLRHKGGENVPHTADGVDHRTVCRFNDHGEQEKRWEAMNQKEQADYVTEHGGMAALLKRSREVRVCTGTTVVDSKG